MRKMVFGRKLSRGRKSREALFGSLVRALVANGKIVTTKAKAKAIRGEVDKLLVLAKKNTVSGQRTIAARLKDRKSQTILLTKVVPALADVKFGFTKIVYLPSRLGDSAKMASMEWIKKVDYLEKKADRKVGKKIKSVKSVKK